MDQLVVERKIESLRKCIARVEQRCPVTLDELIADLDAQDVLVLNLTRSVQLCVDISMHILSTLNRPIPETMGQSFTELAEASIIDKQLADDLCKAVGFRNVAVHNYEEINWAIVFAIAREKLENFKRFVAQIDIK